MKCLDIFKTARLFGAYLWPFSLLKLRQDHPETYNLIRFLGRCLIAFLLLVGWAGIAVGPEGKPVDCGWVCFATETQHALFSRMKDFALGFGALIGAAGIMLGHAYSHEKTVARERAEADRQRNAEMRAARARKADDAAHLVGEIQLLCELLDRVFDQIIFAFSWKLGTSKHNIQFFEDIIKHMASLDSVGQLRSRFFSCFFSVEISTAGARCLSSLWPEISSQDIVAMRQMDPFGQFRGLRFPDQSGELEGARLEGVLNKYIDDMEKVLQDRLPSLYRLRHALSHIAGGGDPHSAIQSADQAVEEPIRKLFTARVLAIQRNNEMQGAQEAEGVGGSKADTPTE